MPAYASASGKIFGFFRESSPVAVYYVHVFLLGHVGIHIVKSDNRVSRAFVLTFVSILFSGME